MSHCRLAALILSISLSASAQTGNPPDQNGGSAAPAASDPVKSGNPATRFIRDYASDQRRIWLAPFHMNQRQFWTVAVPLVGGTAALVPLDVRTVNALPNTPDQIDISKKISLVGSAFGLTAGVAATTLTGHYAGKPSLTEMGRDGSLALASSLTVTYVVKSIFWRERPDAPGSRGHFWSGGDSFPSGHAMTSFAVASAIASNKRCPKWLGITLYATASAISLSRISSNRHWPSDVYFGAFSGFLIGRSIANAAHSR